MLSNDLIFKIDALVLGCCSVAARFEFSLQTLAFCQFMLYGDSSLNLTRLFFQHIASETYRR